MKVWRWPFEGSAATSLKARLNSTVMPRAPLHPGRERKHYSLVIWRLAAWRGDGNALEKVGECSTPAPAARYHHFYKNGRTAHCDRVSGDCRKRLTKNADAGD